MSISVMISARMQLGFVAYKNMIFNSFTESNAFEVKGSKVALGRWFPWIGAAQFFDPLSHSRRLVLMCHGMVNGIYTTYLDVPIWTAADSERLGFVAGDYDPVPGLAADD